MKVGSGESPEPLSGRESAQQKSQTIHDPANESRYGMTRKREQQVLDLLLQGCDNREIAKEMHIALRTVKAHFNRLFTRFHIQGGVKRVKLAVLIYRELCSQQKNG